MSDAEVPIETVLAPFISAHRLNTLIAAESEFFSKATRFKGYGAICDSFRCLVMDNVVALNVETSVDDPPVSEAYRWVLLRSADNFHWLCAAEQQAFAGYPFPALSQLRNIFDSAVITAAVAQGMSTIDEVEGTDGPNNRDPASVRKRRKKAELRITDLMRRTSSGLTPESQIQLAKVNELFDLETHGHRLTATRASEWLAGREPLRVLPHFTDIQFAAFFCRHIETMWMVHRLLSLTRLPTLRSRDQFKAHWEALDNQFHRCSRGLAEQVGKPVGAAIVEFVTLKFPFTADSNLSI